MLRFKRIEKLYLNPDESADVWFKVDDERIPAHKLILSAVSPWFKTMFHGSLQENGDVDMSDSATAAELKEFLQFFYLFEVKLTEENIEGVLDLAKQSLVEEFFTECEEFLIKKVSVEKVFWYYDLAVLYDAKKLKQCCEEKISTHFSKLLKSEHFLNARHETIRQMVKMDAFNCNEKEILDACIAWAKTACKKNDLDSSKSENLRDQLKDILFEIRFASVRLIEFGNFLYTYPDILSNEEIQESIFIMSDIKEFKPKWFNRKTRSIRFTLGESISAQSNASKPTPIKLQFAKPVPLTSCAKSDSDSNKLTAFKFDISTPSLFQLPKADTSSDLFTSSFPTQMKIKLESPSKSLGDKSSIDNNVVKPYIPDGYRTVKHMNLMSGPIGNKSVRDLPGIGDANGSRLEAAGYTRASQLYDKYMQMGKNGDKFEIWLKQTCGAYSNHASAMRSCFDEYSSHN